MNKRIRSLIDEIFSNMKMTAENLALRDELMANAQDRYEDAVRQGRSEEDAFAEVAASLGDVQALLLEMNGDAREEEAAKQPPHEEAPQQDAATEQPTDTLKSDTDLGATLNKAFTALDDLGKQIAPQAKKLAKQLDSALDGLGKAVGKGMKDAQNAANEAIDRLSSKKGEIVIDFGKKNDTSEGEITIDFGKKNDAPGGVEKTSEDLRQEAATLRAQAKLKEVSGDAEGARTLEQMAETLEKQADSGASAHTSVNDAINADGELDPEAFSQAVDDMVRDAQEAAGEGQTSTEGQVTFPSTGLRAIDIKVDEDDVIIKPSDDLELSVHWSGISEENKPIIKREGHTLTIRRPNPNVFKTFFSVFNKEGGEIVVHVPRGYAADYALTTTSGDIDVQGVDADEVKISSTSGNVRLETDTRCRAKAISVSTVSGNVTVSACVEAISVNTVSGEQFISCDAGKVDVDCVSGDMHIKGAADDWEASTVSGDMELLCTVTPMRKIQLSTISGDAHLALPADIRGFVAELSGTSGSIENEFGPNRYGTCALPIHMDTMSGSLTITRL